MQFDKVAKSFLDHLQIERALSANSISAYKRDLAKFEAFLRDKSLDLASVSEEDIVIYEVHQKAAGLSLASINRSTSALKTFYKYLVREHSISDPTTGITSNKLARKLLMDYQDCLKNQDDINSQRYLRLSVDAWILNN